MGHQRQPPEQVAYWLRLNDDMKRAMKTQEEWVL